MLSARYIFNARIEALTELDRALLDEYYDDLLCDTAALDVRKEIKRRHYVLVASNLEEIRERAIGAAGACCAASVQYNTRLNDEYKMLLTHAYDADGMWVDANASVHKMATIIQRDVHSYIDACGTVSR